MEQNNLEQNRKHETESIIVSYGLNIASAEKRLLTEKGLHEIINEIRSSEELRNATHEIRSHEDKDERTILKRKLLPFLSFGKFRDRDLNNSAFIGSEFIVFDYDEVGDSLEMIKAAIKADPATFMLFLSPSGNGLKQVVRLEKMVTDISGFKKICKTHKKVFENRYSATIDPSSCEAARACYFSYDEDLYFNPNAETLPCDFIEDHISSAVQASVSPFDGVKEGSRDTSMVQLIGRLISEGYELEPIINMVLGWNTKNIPPLPDEEVEEKVRDKYEKWQSKYNSLPVRFTQVGNRYSKSTTRGGRIVSTFIIRPKELLQHEKGDRLICDIVTLSGDEFKDVAIDNTDWLSKTKFIKAIGHSECSYLSDDKDLQALCAFVNMGIPIKKRGTQKIGLIDDTWVVKDCNVTKDGLQENIRITAFDKGGDSLVNKIEYTPSTSDESSLLVKELCEHLFKINKPEVITPIIGWMMSCPVKPIIMKEYGQYPILFLHGSQGGGKSSTMSLFMKLHGYKHPIPMQCTIKQFPLVKMLSSTNAIPVNLDEFKKADMREDTYNNLLRTLRVAYNGEIETKGHQDQTTEDYHLEAPIVLAGEWNINQPAIKERIILVRFNDGIKKDHQMREAFQHVSELNLEAFMPNYIRYCLNQDIISLYNTTRQTVNEHFMGKNIAPRVVHNLCVMLLGLELFKGYATTLGHECPTMDFGNLLDGQLREITGNTTGFVKSAVDQLIEELAVMAQKR